MDLTKVPGTRALLKGDKRLREVGFDHFKKERGLKRENRNSRLPVAMPFSKEYNDVLDQLLDKDAVAQSEAGNQGEGAAATGGQG